MPLKDWKPEKEDKVVPKGLKIQQRFHPSNGVTGRRQDIWLQSALDHSGPALPMPTFPNSDASAHF